MLVGIFRGAHVLTVLLMMAVITQRTLEPSSTVQKIILTIALGLLLAILFASTGVVKKSWSRGIQVPLHVGWLVCLAWFSWLSENAPLKLHELVGVDFDNPASIARIEQANFYRSLAVFLFIAVLTSLPLFLKARRTPAEPPAPDQTAKMMVIVSGVLFLVACTQAWMTVAPSSYRDIVIISSFLFSLLLSGIAASRGSGMGLSVAIGEAMLPAFLTIVIGH